MIGITRPVLLCAGIAAISATSASAQFRLGAKPEQILSVEVRTGNFSAMQHFYTEVIGMKELPGSNAAAKPNPASMLSFSGSYDDSFLSLSGVAATPAALRLTLKLKLSDVRAAVERARSEHAVIEREPMPAHGMPGLIVAVIRDPDGNDVELVQTSM